MNKLARAVLTLYSYDDDPDDLSLENNMRQSISLIARMPAIMTYAYQVKRRHYDKQTMFFHPFEPQHKTAEAILNALREDRQFTHEEAQLLDLCMVLHAENGGGNNSTFTTRVLSSAQTDIYSIHRRSYRLPEGLPSRRREPQGTPDDDGHHAECAALGQR